MDEPKTKNERSMELAIRTELAYRIKLAGLGFNQENPSRVLMPLPVPSKPNPTNENLQLSQPLPISFSNRPQNPIPEPLRTQNPVPKPLRTQNLTHQQIPERNQKHKPNPNPRPTTTFPTSSARPNLSGNKRKEILNSNFQNHPSNNPKPSPSNSKLDYITMTPEGYSYCNICDVPCSCRLNLQQHLKGKQHKTKMEHLEWTKRGFSRPSCETCHIYCTDADGLRMHYKGQKHKTKVRQLEEKRDKHRTCELCQIWSIDETAHQQHLKGKKHMARLLAA